MHGQPIIKKDPIYVCYFSKLVLLMKFYNTKNYISLLQGIKPEAVITV
jgi:hypothetical protein